MENRPRLGIIGGMGSVAAAYFFDRLVQLTPAKTDQEYVETFLHNNTAIPDRTAGILYGQAQSSAGAQALGGDPKPDGLGLHRPGLHDLALFHPADAGAFKGGHYRRYRSDRRKVPGTRIQEGRRYGLDRRHPPRPFPEAACTSSDIEALVLNERIRSTISRNRSTPPGGSRPATSSASPRTVSARARRC